MALTDFVPYQMPVRSIVIQQLTHVGWVELIRIPIENTDVTPEALQNDIAGLRNMLYEGDKMFLNVQGMELCVRGIQEGATFRVCASAQEATEPFMI